MQPLPFEARDPSLGLISYGKYVIIFTQCHHGLIASGHYVTYARNANGKWYLFNDSSCRVSESRLTPVSRK